jgi:cytochrome-b5 reductase
LGLPIGQHISICAQIDDKEISRSYTPITSDDDRGYFDLMIKVITILLRADFQSYPNGNISRAMAALVPGVTIKVKGPKGQMVYKPNMVREIGMLAGGTGITPMLQIVRAILKNPEDKTRVTLIYANVTTADILLKEDLEKLAQINPHKFKLYLVVEKPLESWTGGVGFITEAMIREYCPAPANDIKILICGPPPMVSAMKKTTEVSLLMAITN